ncbi:MAG: OmpW family outer membrane protein, partial [Bacteroidota bacterium]|nr:OmpW family outer membrane protein [Bacteroidota bacterium]
MRKRILVAVMAFIGLSNLAVAQDAPADNGGKWQFRLRGIVVSPDESADIEAIGGDVDISTSVVPEFDITYFFDDNWSMELILGTTKHDVEA